MNSVPVSAVSGNRADTPLTDYFRAYRADVLFFLRSKLASPEQADDLLQQTFLRLLERNPSTEIENPKAYLITIARHVLADYYRQLAIRFPQGTVDFEDVELEDESHSPFADSVSEEYLDNLADAIANLSLPVQRAFVLSRVYGYTYREVADFLGLSPRTVEKHVAKGLAFCFSSMQEARQLAAGDDEDS